MHSSYVKSNARMLNKFINREIYGIEHIIGTSLWVLLLCTFGQVGGGGRGHGRLFTSVLPVNNEEDKGRLSLSLESSIYMYTTSLRQYLQIVDQSKQEQYCLSVCLSIVISDSSTFVESQFLNPGKF